MMRHHKTTLSRALLLLLATMTLLLANCQRQEHRRSTMKHRWTVMGTFVELSQRTERWERPPNSHPLVRDILLEAEQRLSTFRDDSEISLINQSAGNGELIPVSQETARLLLYSQMISVESQGAFDITIAPMMSLWGFRGRGADWQRPSISSISNTLGVVGWHQLEVYPSSGDRTATARLKLPGMRLDLGAIGKGDAVDLAYDTLKALNETNFLINLAGNMRGSGSSTDERLGWVVAIRNPAGGYDLGSIMLMEGEGIATSGNYEQYVVIDGERYTHIVDPRTGFPIKGLASVTVVANSAMEADALSTALFVSGIEGSASILAHHPDCGAIFITDEPKPRLVVTRYLHDRLTLSPRWRNPVELIK